MPKRNAIKQYGAQQYYHCYNRGVDKTDLFRDVDDYGYFLSLFARHLSLQPRQDKTRRQYPHYAEQVELVAYCLLPNHYHLLLYLKEPSGIEKLMRSVMTAYSRYANVKYNRTGTLFEGGFLGSRINSDAYLWHISRYIHMNSLDIHMDPLTYAFSSLGYFQGEKTAEWVHPELLVTTREEKEAYIASLGDAAEYHELRNKLRAELAN